MSASALLLVGLAVGAGMLAQSLAARFSLPGVVLLLATGVLLGPDLLGLFDPAVFGDGRRDLVSLAVTVILFEGGLGLDATRLREHQRTLVLLVTLGAAISMAGGALAAHLVLGLPREVALLYGAIMIVTGPTVVTPLLARLTVTPRVRQLLVSEGVLIDPVGAVIAIVAAEWVVGRHEFLESGWRVLAPLGVGAALGVAAGLAVGWLLRRRFFPDELAGPSVLGLVLLVAGIANDISPEAGLMSAVALGVTIANTNAGQLGRLREFKEALTVVLLAFLFVLLGAALRLREVQALGLEALGVVAILAWVARPLAIAVCTLGSGLSARERAFAAWICPRGVVAAAVAGLFRILLDGAGIPGGSELEALVFVTIVATVAVQGLTAGVVARSLGIDFPALAGTIVVGADRLGRLLAHTLVERGRDVTLLDRNPWLCRVARGEGLEAQEGDAFSAETLEEVGIRHTDTLVAITRNAPLNELVVQRVRERYRVERLLALGAEEREGRSRGRAQPFPGSFPGVDATNTQLRTGALEVVEYVVPEGEAVGRPLGELPFAKGEFALVLERGASGVVATADQTLAEGDHLWCARPKDAPAGLGGLLAEAERGA
jgi:NhaP-type Na+/H+ or K+/H+ antiporter